MHCICKICALFNKYFKKRNMTVHVGSALYNLKNISYKPCKFMLLSDAYIFYYYHVHNSTMCMHPKFSGLVNLHTYIKSSVSLPVLHKRILKVHQPSSFSYAWQTLSIFNNSCILAIQVVDMDF